MSFRILAFVQELCSGTIQLDAPEDNLICEYAPLILVLAPSTETNSGSKP